MNINDLSAYVSNSIDHTPQRLLYEYVETHSKLRISDFARFCGQRGAKVYAEDIISMMDSSPDLLFTENSDKQGRFWSINIADGYVPHGMQAGPYGVGTSDIPDPYDDQGDMSGISEEDCPCEPECECGPDCDCENCRKHRN